jgi:nitrate/TMAO reductase-like tetraheme cytochrome c subunit
MQPRRILAVGGAILVLSAGLVIAADYIGVSKCKLCHKLQYDSWSKLAHAKALEAVPEADRSKPECLKCHATGGQADLPGVQCEACHGPGSEYKSIKVMKDKDAALAAGLVLPDEKTCKGCHENAPHEVPPFDYKTALPKGVHAHKAG